MARIDLNYSTDYQKITLGTSSSTYIIQNLNKMELRVYVSNIDNPPNNEAGFILGYRDIIKVNSDDFVYVKNTINYGIAVEFSDGVDSVNSVNGVELIWGK